MISDPRILAIAFGNVTWKMVLKCRWVGGGEERGEADARLERRQQQQWLWNHRWLCVRGEISPIVVGPKIVGYKISLKIDRRLP